MKFFFPLLAGGLGLLFPLRSSAETPDIKIDWGEMLAGYDMVWGRLPNTWDEAPFLGNGEQGTLMYRIDKRTLRWDVGCSAAHDHRPFEDDDLTEKNVDALNRGRLFIGHLRVKVPVDLTGGQSRLSLWDAEATGTLKSAAGSAEWITLVHATEPVMRFEISATGDLAGAEFSYMAEEAQNPRAVRAKTPRTPANLPPVISELADGMHTAVHYLDAGGQTAVAWLEREEDGKKRLWLSVKHSFPGMEASAQAVAAVLAAANADQEVWVKRHRDWWHNYYPDSFISTGDPFWDSFYWVQQYKLACATRDKGWIIDNQGPWLQPTAWNALWWNLNVQLSHSGVYQANRRGMGSALSHRLDINRENLALNVAEEYREDSYAIGRNTSGWDLLGHAGQPGGRAPMDGNIGRECGNLMWALHNVDLEVRYWQDQRLRDEVLYPLLVRAVNYYRHFLVKEADGLYHLPETYSPEYRRAKDCTYDIDLLGWGVSRLLELASEKGLRSEDEPLIETWSDIQKNLVPAHVDKTGRMIGKNVALTGGHRHWSHLLAIYPLRTLTPKTEEDRELIKRSLDHWHSFGKAAAGYYFTGGACMAAVLGDGDRALGLLNRLKPFLKPNTFYSEIGLPVMETPIHGATAIQEMLLQSWGGRLRVFPAVPSEWPDVYFHQLRGEGAFLVSACMEKGLTKWVLVEAEAGGSVEVEPQLGDMQWIASPGTEVTVVDPFVYAIKSSPGGKVLFWPNDKPKPEIIISPVRSRGEATRFGLRDGYKK
ncbi:MAG: hypothetical protein NWT08_01310 [Akkermansiaceae bacterium]|jgi:alpha-L-fucosidase 2|nr:hypothetical protein [Akkermansiaceae bacterium]MDP4719899.1 hypothetical protein [Akkermansiaceae bacterium]MDP4896431.1 hypothetical protein [Akkermansiaceae bacterium]